LLPSPSPSLFLEASECCLSRAAHLLGLFTLLGLTFDS
jgi:hypothetical protein